MQLGSAIPGEDHLTLDNGAPINTETKVLWESRRGFSMTPEFCTAKEAPRLVETHS